MQCLSMSTNSVHAEQLFSFYSDLLLADRPIIKAENLPMHKLLYQNSGKLETSM